MRRSWLLTRRGACVLALAAAAGLALASSAQAANLVPNPGFELGGTTPTSWSHLDGFTILRDTVTPTHDDGTNTASLFASGVSVGSNPGAISDCTTGITPLTHADVSFWYLTSSVAATGIGFEVNYYSDSNCQTLISGGLIE